MSTEPRSVQIEPGGLKGVVVAAVPRHLDTDVTKQLNEVVHVENVGDIAHPDRLFGEQRGADHLQRLILGPLGSDGTAEPVPAFNNE